MQQWKLKKKFKHCKNLNIAVYDDFDPIIGNTKGPVF